MMRERLCSKHVVLLGVGHTNAHVVRMWREQPLADADLTCITDYPIATYSGMLPAALAGQIPQADMEIDLVRLCASAGARLIQAPVSGLDQQKQQIEFLDRPAVPFDVLSVGIGSVPSMAGVAITGNSLVPIKPMQTFLERLRKAVTSRQPTDRQPFRAVIVGSGVAGIEIAFCLPAFLQSLGMHRVELQIVSQSESVLPELGRRGSWQVQSELSGRGIIVTLGKTVKSVDDGQVELQDGSRLAADVVLWATGANAPPLLSQLNLPLDERGFITTDYTLRSLSGLPIFAVGDSGSLLDEPLPKAGVYAVRQAPILWDNINRVLREQPLVRYRPQRSFLKLINLGDGRALGAWQGFSFAGRWVMRWKQHIDSTFVEKYQPDRSHLSGQPTAHVPMPCRGCGSKLSATLLQSGLEPLSVAAEDAVVVGGQASSAIVASTDFFPSPFDDAYLNGRIAALHAANDILVSGAQATDALTNLVLPEGGANTQRKVMQDFLIGAQREFASMGAKIVGGHTIVGPRMEVGFTVIGQSNAERQIRKGNLQVGDLLFLTKPLGIGVLLAAHSRGACPAHDYGRLIDAMLFQQHHLARMAVDSGITAGTDISGFGLCGHLLEMLQASQVAAAIFLEDIPLLDGVLSALALGIESSLVQDNLHAEEHIDAVAEVRELARYRVLFDPQTCGGFLFGVPPIKSTDFLRRIEKIGLPPPAHIGEVGQISKSGKLLDVQRQR